MGPGRESMLLEEAASAEVGSDMAVTCGRANAGGVCIVTALSQVIKVPHYHLHCFAAVRLDRARAGSYV